MACGYPKNIFVCMGILLGGEAYQLIFKERFAVYEKTLGANKAWFILRAPWVQGKSRSQ